MLKTFQIIYNHCEIYDWVHNNFLSRQRISQQPLQLNVKQRSLPEHLGADKFYTAPKENILDPLLSTSKPANNGILEGILKRIVVKGMNCCNTSF